MSRDIQSDGKKARRFDGFFMNPGDLVVDHEQNVRFASPSEDDPGLIEMAHSLINSGQLQPCLIRPVGGGSYQLFVGYRRHAACVLANKWLEAEGKEPLKLKVMCQDANPQQSYFKAIEENSIRREHTPMDIAKIINTLRERYGMASAEIALRFKNRKGEANSVPWVNQMEALMNLDSKLQMEVHNGHLSVSDATRLLEMKEENRLPALELALAFKEAEDASAATPVQVVTKKGKTVKVSKRGGRKTKSVGESNLRKAAEALGESLGGTMRMSEFRQVLMLEDGPGSSLKVRKILRLTNQFLQRGLTEKQWMDGLEAV